jgi:hypothetical protein
MRNWSILAAVVAVAVSGVALAAKSGRPGTAVAAADAPISILDLTLKAGDLPVQDGRDAI